MTESAVSFVAARHSVPAGDVVLVHAPPYGTMPWIGMGVVLHHALLSNAGITPRVVRLLDRLDDVPSAILEASMFTFLRDPRVDERLDAIERARSSSPEFFEAMLDRLLAGPEAVFAFSVWRNNADVSLLLAKLLKERRPSCFVIFGGPEPIEETEPYRVPWVDAILSTNAERTIVPLTLAALAGRPEQARDVPGIWLNPSLGVGLSESRASASLPGFELPDIDYRRLIPLLVGDPNAAIPILMNWGCPYHCEFCSNRNVYGRFAEGSVERVLRDVDRIVEACAAEGRQDVSIQFSDATTNALPPQFDVLMRGLIDRQKGWPIRPTFRGQTLFDESHMSAERARLMADANFATTFFGLDAVGETHRRSLKKPGRIASVARAMEEYRQGGGRGLFFGIPVGMPGETREDHARVIEFLDWSVSLEGTLEGITILPYVFFLSAQGADWNGRNVGERRGVLWRMDDPSGDPAERARRMMCLYEKVDNRVEAVTPFPHHMTLPMMLPPERADVIERFLARYGRVHQPLRERFEWRLAERHDKVAFGGLTRSDVESALRSASPEGGWSLSRFDWLPPTMPEDAIVLHFSRDDERSVVVLERPAPDKRAFGVAGCFALSYLKSWRGAPCAFDAALMTFCAARVEGLRPQGETS